MSVNLGIDRNDIKFREIKHNSIYNKGIEYRSSIQFGVSTFLDHRYINGYEQYHMKKVKEEIKDKHAIAINQIIYNGYIEHIQRLLIKAMHSLDNIDTRHVGNMPNDYVVVRAYELMNTKEEIKDIIRGLEECPNTHTNVETVKI